jgi:hypothetical protein
MIEEFGSPICVLSTGNHDIAVPNITKAIYMKNLQWYLAIVSLQCDYIIWVANTCPMTNTYLQTKAATFDWNLAAKDLLLSSPEFRPKSFFLDVFNASVDYPHADNIHMKGEWYGALASFLQQLMETDIGWYESY